MLVGHPGSLERQSLVVYESTASRASTTQRALHTCRADFESISPVLLHAPENIKTVGPYKRQIDAVSSCFSAPTVRNRRSGIGVKWRTIRTLAAVAQW
jgi:hypothetical protein